MINHCCQLGPPLRPIIVNFSQEHIVNSSNFTYHLNWSAPFTWPGFPTLSYNITMLNHLDNESTTTIIPTNESSQTLSLDGITYGDRCYRLTFYVSASNHLGDGEHSMMHSGHHIGKLSSLSYTQIMPNMLTYIIVPGEISDIETTVTFLSNGTPHLWMSFLVSREKMIYTVKHINKW